MHSSHQWQWPTLLLLLFCLTLSPLLLLAHTEPPTTTTTTNTIPTNVVQPINVPTRQTVNILVPNGPIIGEKYTVRGPEREMIRFRGIPYARPPIGKLRFRRPLPIGKNVEPIRALDWSPNCMQTTLSNKISDVMPVGNYSEDCLFLNVWSPDVNVDQQHLLPVIVYIFGGGLIMGSSSGELYDGETLSAMTDSVVVTFNYRLSTLGFFHSTVLDDVKGNQGLWDQSLALHWVNDNIRYFGGNSKQITLMGQSAGSWSVSAHILSPVSRDLFQRAVLLSGAVSNLNVHNPERVSTLLLHGIRQVGCATDQDITINETVLECLEELDTDKLLSVMFLAKDNAYLDLPELIVADGEFIPKQPSELFSTSDHKKDFHILIGTVEDEGSTILAMVPNLTQFSTNDPSPITLNEAKELLTDIVSKQMLQRSIDTETVDKVYFAGLNPNFDNQHRFRRQVGIAFGDLLLTCPTVNFARTVYQNSPQTVTVYQLYHKAKIGSKKLGCSEWMGSCHGLELYPLFGVPFRRPKMFHNRERQISREIIDILRSFIRTGKPDETQPEWLPYFMANNGTELIAPYYEIGNNVKSFESFKFNLKQTECGSIWNQYLSN